MKGTKLGSVKVKFSTLWRDGNEVYEQGKSYEVPHAVASTLIRDGVAVVAPQNAQKSVPRGATNPVSKNGPDTTKKGGK